MHNILISPSGDISAISLMHLSFRLFPVWFLQVFSCERHMVMLFLQGFMVGKFASSYKFLKMWLQRVGYYWSHYLKFS